MHECRLMRVAPILAPDTVKAHTNLYVQSMFMLHIDRECRLPGTVATGFRKQRLVHELH
jgi:hypothetical protein